MVLLCASLYGTNIAYFKGIYLTITFFRRSESSYKFAVFFNNTVPRKWVEGLATLGVILVDVETKVPSMASSDYGMFWRFLPILSDHQTLELPSSDGVFVVDTDEQNLPGDITNAVNVANSCDADAAWFAKSWDHDWVNLPDSYNPKVLIPGSGCFFRSYIPCTIADVIMFVQEMQRIRPRVAGRERPYGWDELFLSNIVWDKLKKQNWKLKVIPKPARLVPHSVEGRSTSDTEYPMRTRLTKKWENHIVEARASWLQWINKS